MSTCPGLYVPSFKLLASLMNLGLILLAILVKLSPLFTVYVVDPTGIDFGFRQSYLYSQGSPAFLD